jgi:hypothetical protein
MSITLLLELLVAASELSGLPAPAALPEVRVVATSAMPCRCKGAQLDGVLWLSAELDLDGSFGRSVAVHELTHYLQEVHRGAPRDERMRGRQEREALAVQNRWLAQAGSAARAMTASLDD